MVRCSNHALRVDGARIHGSCNKITGSRNVVLGSYNVVVGFDNTLLGVGNKQVSPPEPEKRRESGGEASGSRLSERKNKRKRNDADADADGEAEAEEMDVVDLTSPPGSEIRDRRVSELRLTSQIESDRRIAVRISEAGMSEARSLLGTYGGLRGLFGATSMMESGEIGDGVLGRSVLSIRGLAPGDVFDELRPIFSGAGFHVASSSSPSSSSSASGSGTKPLTPSAEQVAKEKSASAPEGAREDDLCVICKDRPRTSMALPCQHVAFCAPCGRDCVEIHRMEKCPVCRERMSAGVIVREIWDEK